MMRIKEEEILGIIFKVENNSKKEIPFAFYEFEITDKKVQDLKNIITLIALLVKVSTR